MPNIDNISKLKHNIILNMITHHVFNIYNGFDKQSTRDKFNYRLHIQTNESRPTWPAFICLNV